MTNIETPEGWEPSGPCFTRVYDGKLAVLELDETLDGAYPAVHLERGSTTRVGYLPLAEAVAWANAELGVPQPVEVVEREFADGSVLIHDTENKRAAFTWMGMTSWHCRFGSNQDCHDSKPVMLEIGRRYVRGDA